jgi:hypothetical protein
MKLRIDEVDLARAVVLLHVNGPRKKNASRFRASIET